MKPKYIYDLNIGHFVKVINEDDNQQENLDTNTEQQNTQDQQHVTNKSIDSNEDIQKINNLITQENDRFSKEKITLEKLLNQARTNAAKAINNKSEYNPVDIDANVLVILKKLNDLTKQHYITLCNFEDQKLLILSQLANQNESLRTELPEKYKWLNESNIHTAKIYMKDLVGMDNDKAILKGMADFKRTFRDTNLLYGKDRQGYFLIILDQDDMDVMYDTLDEVGYLRDDIINTVMPQLLDRSKLIQ